MKPLCEKIYFDKIFEIVVLLFATFMDIMFIINKANDTAWLIFIIVFSAILVFMAIDIIYWLFQPRVLIYQYETGIIINRKTKIEYTAIESVKYKNYIRKKMRGNYYKDTWSGVIFLKLKSGKTYKIRNAFYPIEVVDVLSKIKQQRKFR